MTRDGKSNNYSSFKIIQPTTRLECLLEHNAQR